MKKAPAKVWRMAQKDKLRVAIEALDELASELGTMMSKARDVVHDLTCDPGPAGPVVIDFGDGIKRRLAKLESKKRKTKAVRKDSR